MFRTSHTVKTLAAPEEIWDLVNDVSQWKRWLLGIEQVQLHDQVAVGARGLLCLYGGAVHQMVICKYDLGRLEAIVSLRFGVKMHLLIDVSSLPTGSQVKVEGELLGAMSIFHAFGWGRNLKTGIVPAVRRLGVLSQGLASYR